MPNPIPSYPSSRKHWTSHHCLTTLAFDRMVVVVVVVVVAVTVVAVLKALEGASDEYFLK